MPKPPPLSTWLPETAHGFSILDAVGWDGANWVKSIASAAGTPAVGIVTNLLNGNSDLFQLSWGGYWSYPTHGLTAGLNYLDATTAGTLTTSAPSPYAQPVLRVIDVDTFFVAVGSGGASFSPAGTLQDQMAPLYNGAAIQTIDIGWSEAGGTVSATLEANGGGDIQFFFAGVLYTLDCTPTDTVALTNGTDIAPQINYIYVVEAATVLTLTANTTGWPATAHAPVATMLIQSAASVATDGPYKVHAWTDHVAGTNHGHLAHTNKKFRSLNATWVSGTAGADLSSDQFSTTAGVVFQLHEHTMPARDMAASDPLYVVNDPDTAYNRITTLTANVTKLSDGTLITNNRYVNFVLWGVVSEDESDCKIMLNLPNGDYTSAANAQLDSDQTANYSFGTDYVGTAFLIARYTLRYSTGSGGTFTQSLNTDLRGLLPSTSPGGGSITDHGNLAGLTDDDHTQYLLADGTRALTGNLATSGTFDGRDVATDGTKLDGIEALADVTDATNVAAAGAVMEASGNITNNTIPLADSSGDMEDSAITQATADDVAISIATTAPEWGTTLQTLTDAATIAVVGSTGAFCTVTLTDNRAIGNPTAITIGAKYTFVIVQDGVGSHTLTWQSRYKFEGAVEPTLTTTAGAVDIVEFRCLSATVLYCTSVKLDLR